MLRETASVRYRWKLKTGKQLCAMGTSPDKVRAVNEAARYTICFMDENEKLTLTFERMQNDTTHI